MYKPLRYTIVALFVFGLILVRRFEDSLFYDPFLNYFKGDFINNAFPNYNLNKIIVSISSRYFINSILSLGIIWFLFLDKRKVKFTAWVMIGFFFVLLPLYIWMIQTNFSIGDNVGFYIRRFLIQPMLVMILIPAFYYQDYLTKQKTNHEV